MYIMKVFNMQVAKCDTRMLETLTLAQCCAEQFTTPTRDLFGVQITSVSLFAQYGTSASPHLNCVAALLDSLSAGRLSSRRSSSRDVAQSGIIYGRGISFIVSLWLVSATNNAKFN
jgi:hypothetical protein